MVSLQTLPKINLTLLLLSAMMVSFFFDGLTAFQFWLLIIFISLLLLSKQGDRQIRRKLSLAFREDIPNPAFNKLHILLGCCFSPIFLTSIFASTIAAGLSFLVVIAYIKPIIKLIQARQTGDAVEAMAIERVAAHPFQALFHVTGPEKSGYQINQWIPVAERMDIASAICVRELRLLDEIDQTSVPVFFARDITDIEKVVKHGVRVFLYSANFQKNAQTL
jgi:hypothetical protein